MAATWGAYAGSIIARRESCGNVEGNTELILSRLFRTGIKGVLKLFNT